MIDGIRSQALEWIEAGHDAMTRSDDAAARVHFADAAALCEGRSSESDLHARALAGLAQLERARGSLTEADELARRARQALAESVDPDPLAAVEVALETADSTGCGDPDAEVRRALDLATAIADGPTRQDATVRVLRALGALQRVHGRYGAAATTLNEALAMATARFGTSSLERAGILNELGVVSKFAGDWAQAVRCYAEVQVIQDAHGLADSADRATLLHNLGGLEHARGDLGRAEPFARQSVELHARTLGDDHLTTDLDRVALAAILDGRGQRGEARDLLETAIPRLRARLGAHPELAVALNNLGAIAQGEGDLERAEACYREALAIRAQRSGVDSPTLAGTLNNLGTVLRRNGSIEEAAAVYERAIVLLEGVVPNEHPTLQALHRNRARIDPR
ncbi:MAG TPA: tetratricopeptide repeat protein [Candidatus Limnocylindrales bacterium]|nr:tetratricopeptide repeat protein [Candidatus Limnocylindrales bacterium]